jgi:hypothetical protein
MNQRDSIARQPFDKIPIFVLNNNLYANFPLFNVLSLQYQTKPIRHY